MQSDRSCSIQRRRSLATAVALAAMALAPASGFAGERLALVGGPFEIRAPFTDFNPHYLAVARARDAGSFVAVWDESAGPSWLVRAQLFDATGLLGGAALEVNPTTTAYVSAPARVSSDAAGGFLVAWSGAPASGGESWSIWSRRFSAAGTPVGGETRLNGVTSALLDEPTVAMAADGAFTAAWAQQGSGVWFQRYDLRGSPLLAGDQPLPAEGVSPFDFFAPTVAIDPEDGSFVVVRRTRQGPSPASSSCTNFRYGIDLVGQTYSAAGEAVGASSLRASGTGRWVQAAPRLARAPRQRRVPRRMGPRQLLGHGARRSHRARRPRGRHSLGSVRAHDRRRRVTRRCGRRSRPLRCRLEQRCRQRRASIRSLR